MFFKKLLDKKNDKVKFDNISKTNEEHKSVTYGCVGFIGSYRFLSLGLNELVKNLDNDDLKILKREFSDKWRYLNQKLAHPYEKFKIFEYYQKPVYNLKKEDFFSE